MATKAPKKVLFVLPNILGGGAERVVLTFVRHLNRSLFEPSLLLFKREGDYWGEVPQDLKIYHLLESSERFRYKLPKVLKKAVEVASQNDIIVGALEMVPTYVAYAGGRLAGKPVVGWVHIDLPMALSSLSLRQKRLHRLLCSYIYPRLSRIICVSQGVASSLKGLFPRVRSKRISIIYNPLPVELVEPLRDFSHTPVFGENKDVTIVAVGRLVYQKGFDILLRAYALLRKNGFEKSLLLVLGKGEEEANLKNLAEKLGISESVKFLGFQPEPWRFLREADVFVSSSRFEGFSMVIAEAMFCGVPVVATDCPSGPREVLLDGKCGLLVPPEDPVALAEGIRKILCDRGLREKLVQAASVRVRDFLPEKIVPQLEKVLWEVG